jgi:hypothetical protein
MAASLAFNGLRSFLASNYDLAYAPFGSPELFHAAARLSDAGLGSYLTNTPRLIRRSRDIFGMTQLAAGKQADGTIARDLLERWSVLFSQHFPNSLLHELLEELGDLGLMRAVWAIYARILRCSDRSRDPGPLWCIRDIGLDNNDVPLALAAQRTIVHSRPNSSIEWIVLGEIEATYGDPNKAMAAFGRGLSIEPDHQGARERLKALQFGTFEQFAITGGFGTSDRRKLVRSARQQTAVAQ